MTEKMSGSQAMTEKKKHRHNCAIL